MEQGQLDFTLRELGDLGRDAGIAAAVKHAQDEGWSTDAAFAFIVRFAKYGRPFTCPEVRAAAEDAGFPLPPTAFAWGGPMQRAVRAGIIRRHATVQHGDKTMHTQNVTQWAAP